MATQSAPFDGRFDVRFDPNDRVLHMRLYGFRPSEVLHAYAARLTAEGARLKRRGHAFDTLRDSWTCAVRSAKVGAGCDLFAKLGKNRHGSRTAIVVASRLNKLQAERALASDRVRVFLDMEEARQWLTTQHRRDLA